MLKTDTRTRLLRAATRLTYEHGFTQTSLADIATNAEVPLGNVYYHFRTKDEIGAAVVEERLSQVKAQLERLDKVDSPLERLCGFVEMTINNKEIVSKRGCPIGTLCSELHKDGGRLAQRAEILFTEILAWMEMQFRQLGNAAEARGLAVHLLSGLQGASALAHNFHDPEILAMEASRLQKWVRTLETNSNAGGRS